MKKVIKGVGSQRHAECCIVWGLLLMQVIQILAFYFVMRFIKTSIKPQLNHSTVKLCNLFSQMVLTNFSITAALTALI